MDEKIKDVDQELASEELVDDFPLDEEIEDKVEEEEASNVKKRFKKSKKKEDRLEEEIISLKEELGKSQNAYYKAYADTENLKKRLQNDADTFRKYRIQSFAQEVLPVLDNLERAIQFETQDESVKNYVAGIQMIYQQIKTALEKEGVTHIECLNKPFDANLHQALLVEKVADVASGIVVEEIQKGYMLKDRVLRASLVKVSE